MDTLNYTPIDDIPKIHATARKAFESDRTKSIQFRKDQIAQLGYLIKDNAQRIKDAAFSDLHRPSLETDLLDFAPVWTDIKVAHSNVDKWVKPQGINFHPTWFAMRPKVVAEPKGTVLIIAPFNLPIFLIFSPLISAIAAGDSAVIKPSEQTPALSQLLAELLPRYLDPELYHVINGGVPETTKILELQWDHILYTGNGRVGRIVARAAAEHLTPVTLELGGKNPAVIDPKVDLKMAARRLLWGRFSNAGQICLSPDYVLVPEHFQDTLVNALKEVYASFYPEGPEKSDSFARIVTKAHAERVKRLVDRTEGKIVVGGAADVENRYIAPTIVRDVRDGDSLLSEEIFGPVLPIVPVKDVDEAIKFIRGRDNPLAVYVFSDDKAFEEKVSRNTKSGALVTNEVIVHGGAPGLPLGGVGASGYGYYTGKHGFEQFTHWRVSLKNPGWVDKVALHFRFPPYKPKSKELTSAVGAWLPPRPGTAKTQSALKRWAFWLLFATVGASSIVLTRSGMVRQLLLKAQT